MKGRIVLLAMVISFAAQGCNLPTAGGAETSINSVTVYPPG